MQFRRHCSALAVTHALQSLPCAARHTGPELASCFVHGSFFPSAGAEWPSSHNVACVGPYYGEKRGEDGTVGTIEEYFKSRNNVGTLKGKVTALAVTQTGSRFLQKQLANSDLDFTSFILEEVKDYLPGLMIDNYGNYFCQKLISNSSALQRISFLLKVAFNPTLDQRPPYPHQQEQEGDARDSGDTRRDFAGRGGADNSRGNSRPRVRSLPSNS